MRTTHSRRKTAILRPILCAACLVLLLCRPAAAQDSAPTNDPVEIIRLDDEPLQITNAGTDTISITLTDVELADVVLMFTKISGANIIATPANLTGRVTVQLTHVRWQPALAAILELHGMQLTEKVPGSGVYSIVHAHKDVHVRDIVQVIRHIPGNTNAQSLASVDLVNGSIGAALEQISESAGINIAYDRSLRSTTGLTIKREKTDTRELIEELEAITQQPLWVMDLDGFGLYVLSNVLCNRFSRQWLEPPFNTPPHLPSENGGTGKVITVIFADEPMNSAVESLARDGDLNLIARSGDLRGRVTVCLNDVHPRPALESIVETHSLQVVRVGYGPPIYAVVPWMPGYTGPHVPKEHLLFGPTGTIPASTNIDLTLTEATLGTTLTNIARLAKVNISYDTALNDLGHVSIDVRNAPHEDLLWAVLRFYYVHISRSESLGGYSVQYRPPPVYPFAQPHYQTEEPESPLPLRVQVWIALGLVLFVLVTLYGLRDKRR